MSLGVDVGGTFTDLVWWDGQRLRVAKTSTTADQSQGVVSGAEDLLGGVTVPAMLHGTTAATNALLQRAGARVVLVTDEGFEDVIEIGRQHRPSLYDPFADRPPPLVSRGHRVGVAPDLDPGDLARWVAELEPEAVAVSLLRAFADPAREEALAGAVAALSPSLPVSISSLVAPEFREFERTSTVVLTAYLRPQVDQYLTRLQQRVVGELAARLLVMRSNGGTSSAADAARLAAGLLLSGPAGGVVAAAALAAGLGLDRVVSFDMGGTSTDVCRVEDGEPEVGYEREVDGYVCRLPSLAVHTVGAGGGSVGWRDAGGSLRVGPRSAGARPGPAAYGRGGDEPTVTDADLLLGRLDASGRLGGSVSLSPSLAAEALGRLGGELGLGVREVAGGMVEVVEAHMERAVRRVSVEEGADPREAALVAFGGAGGLHAVSLARRLEMAGVVLAPYAGVFSALGLLLAPPREDRARSVLYTREDAHLLDGAVEEVRQGAATGLVGLTGSSPTRVESLVDVRYLGQSHETTVEYRPGEGWQELTERFHASHRRRNGFARPGDPVEAVTVRAVAFGSPVLSWSQLPEHRPEGEARRSRRQVWVGDVALSAEVWWRPGMAAGDEVVGPAVIEDVDSTAFLGPGERGRMHPSGALLVEW